MKILDILENVSHIGDSRIPDDDGKAYYSNIDNSFITRVGMEEDQSFLAKFGITEQIQNARNNPTTSNIGLSPKENKWFGWSHRAIFGFGVGSRCKKGDCGFKPSNKDEFIEKQVSFWGDPEFAVNGEILHKEVPEGIIIYYTYNNSVPNETLRGTKYEHFVKYPETWGRGEWVAETLEDAKQMAIDFALSV